MQNYVSPRYLNILLITVFFLAASVGWLIASNFSISVILGSAIGLIILGITSIKFRLLQIKVIAGFILGLYVLSFSLTRTDLPWITINELRIPIHILLLPILIILHLLHKSDKRAVINNNRNKIIPYTNILLLGILALIPLFVSLIFADNKISSIQLIFEISIYFLGFYFFSQFVDDFKIWKILLWIYIITSIVVVAVSLYNYFFSPLHYRLGPTKTPVFNQFAFSLELAVLFMVSVILSKRRILGFLLSFLAFSTLLLGFILTYSRGAWIAALIGSIFFGILSIRLINPRRIILLLTMFSLLLATIFILRPPFLFQRLATAAEANSRRFEESNISRLSIYELGIDLVMESPIIGIGWGQELTDNLTNAHNSFIALWVGSGVFSLLIFIFILIIHGRNLWLSRKYLNQYYLAGNVLFSTFIATIFLMLFKNIFFDSFFWAFLGLQAAAVNVYSLSSNTNTFDHDS